MVQSTDMIDMIGRFVVVANLKFCDTIDANSR